MTILPKKHREPSASEHANGGSSESQQVHQGHASHVHVHAHALPMPLPLGPHARPSGLEPGEPTPAGASQDHHSEENEDGGRGRGAGEGGDREGGGGEGSQLERGLQTLRPKDNSREPTQRNRVEGPEEEPNLEDLNLVLWSHSQHHAEPHQVSSPSINPVNGSHCSTNKIGFRHGVTSTNESEGYCEATSSSHGSSGKKRRHPRGHRECNEASVSFGKRHKSFVADGEQKPSTNQQENATGDSNGPSALPPRSPTGYNSEDEYSHLGLVLSEEQWLEKDHRFEQAMKKKGYLLKEMVEDGSCLFRAIADQIYGDQEMHGAVRNDCMNYIAQNADYFGNYVTEDISDYVERKRYQGVHGNHLEIQALSEMYSRPIHIFCYSEEPINIFQNVQQTNCEKMIYPIRLCYHRECHYNSLIDPQKATVGIGLGLPDYSPGSADRNLVGAAVKASEEDLVERTMLEDKIKATDWEATNEAIEEQIARESYLQWLRDNERRPSGSRSSATATITSGTETRKSLDSPKASCSVLKGSPQKHVNSPKAGCSTEVDNPKPCSSGKSHYRNQSGETVYKIPNYEYASFLDQGNCPKPGRSTHADDWTSDPNVLAQVLATSQQEYLDSLKKQMQNKKS